MGIVFVYPKKTRFLILIFLISNREITEIIPCKNTTVITATDIPEYTIHTSP